MQQHQQPVDSQTGLHQHVRGDHSKHNERSLGTERRPYHIKVVRESEYMLNFIMIIIPILMACELFGVLKQVKADECNQVATLIEAKKIYLTQPLDINTPLSFNDYIHLFERMAQDINAEPPMTA